MMFKSFFTFGSGLLLSPFCSIQVIILFCLVALDLVLGVSLAIRFRRFEVYLLSKTVLKVLFYSMTILASVGVDYFFNLRMFLIQGFVIPFLVVTEVLSVLLSLTELRWFERRFPRFSYWIRNE